MTLIHSILRPIRSRGYIAVLSLVFLGIFFTIATAYLSSVTSLAKSTNGAITAAQALAIAEAGIDRAVYKLNQDSTYIGETDTGLGAGTFTVTVTTVNATTRQVAATGYVPDRTHPLATKTVRANVSVSNAAIAFHYGVQTGVGGLTLTGGATIHGDVYSNGSINATTGVNITGSAVAANPPALGADQVNDTPAISSCTSSTCITFANAQATQDLTQSFKISSAVGLNMIQFYIKKVGAPADASVRIVNDNSGKPSTDVLMTGTLSASTVSTSFGWVSVPLPATPILDPSQIYWVVIDAGSNTSKYYVIGANSGGYANGVAEVGQYGGQWSATTPAGLDAYFRLYLGGGTSIIGGNTYTTGVYIGTTASDSAWAHTVKGATVTGPLYCQTGSYTNKSCDTSRADPTPQAMPLSDANIQDWKDEAAASGTIMGDYHAGWAGATLGPKHITGDLLVDGGGTLTVSGTLWVEGSITVTSGAHVVLAPSYGTASGVIVADGSVTINGGSSFAGSGTTGSYPFLVTTSACPAAPGCSGADAVALSGGAGTVALIAENGNVHISGGTALKEVTAKEITMDGGASLTYDSGLISTSFTSGPGGSWTFVPGTYAIAP
jgi:hypothetical protein